MIAIPNVSEGKDRARLHRLAEAVEQAGARVLDLHSDEVHARSVLTCWGPATALCDAMVALAERCRDEIDLRTHTGVHPRLGALDVCPFVPYGDAPMSDAVKAARATAQAIGGRVSVPVYLYGEAARRNETRELADLRRGGSEALAARMEELPPDHGPAVFDPRTGVVCAGARGVLIAFNIWLRAALDPVKAIAAAVRTSGGGPPGVKALALPIAPEVTQVSMNLVNPDETGIDHVFDLVARQASAMEIEIAGTEIVGLVSERHLPDPDGETARRLISPGRSLESAISAG